MSTKTVSQEIAEVLNKYSLEQTSNTPDFIIAAYLLRCLEAVESFTVYRDEWYGSHPHPGQKRIGFRKPEFPKMQRLIDYAGRKAEDIAGVAGGLVRDEYAKVVQEARDELETLSASARPGERCDDQELIRSGERPENA